MPRRLRPRPRQPRPVASRVGRFYDWQPAQSADESWRGCHLHAWNHLGTHDYALVLAEVIERRAAGGEDYLHFLTDPFARDLTGEDGHLTFLLEIRALNLPDEAAWWTTVDHLHTGGDLAADRYGALLDGLHPADSSTTSATAGGEGVTVPRRAAAPFTGD